MWDKLEEKYKDEFSPFMKELKDENNLKEVIFLGRGGQGMWTVGELLCAALIENGKYAKVVFIMTMDRRNTLARSYIRYSDKPMSFPVSYIYNPDELVISDNSIFNFKSLVTDYDVPEVLRKMGKHTLCLINTSKSPKKLGLDYHGRLATVDATSIALEVLGSATHINTPMLGAYIRATKVIKFEDFEQALLRYHNPRGHEIFRGEIGKRNIMGARMGYENLKFWEEQ
jgi:2-oxoacid:acceptor oxidoreductase gamma subunit (pyruvate/2-ketoisovalerate family)